MSADLLSDLRACDAGVDARPAALRAYRRDAWPRLTLSHRDGEELPAPAVIARPRSEEAVVAVLRVARRHGAPVVPYGSGSGVCGGAAALDGCVVVDVKHLDRLGDVDPRRLRVRCGPGLNLQTCEQRLNDAGYTLGHFPSSIYAASVGGCVAARGAGQLSSRYGKAEDFVTGMHVATAELGLLRTGSLDPSAPAVDWSPVFVGSEGTLGVLTDLELRVHPLAERLALRGLRFPSVGNGLEAFREILQDGLRPSVLRLYDPLDTWMAMNKGNDRGGAEPLPGGGDPLALGARPAPPENATEPTDAPGEGERLLGSVVSPGSFVDELRRALSRGPVRALSSRLTDRLMRRFRPDDLPVDRLLARPSLVNAAVNLLPGRSLGIIGCEGPPDVAAAELEACVAAARRLGAVDLGPGPGERWFRTRYHVSFKLPGLLDRGGFADTFETAAPWTAVGGLYDAVRKAVSPHVLVLAHFSHAYHEGCSIYFTLVGFGATEAETRRRYEGAWSAALRAAQEAGGVLSHHHGIGSLKAERMDAEHGDGRLLFEGVAAAVGRLNPGRLFPEPAPPPGAPLPDPDPTHLTVHPHADGVIECGVGWRGVDLAAELALRGHYLPWLGRPFLEGTVEDWLRSPAAAAWTAIHGAWEHPLVALEGRTPGGRAWRSGKRPRAACGPDWRPFGLGPDGRPASVTLRTLTPPKVRPVAARFPRLDVAARALEGALRGAPRPLAGAVLPGAEPGRWRHMLHDAPSARDGGLVYLALHDPDGFPQGSESIVARLGGERLSDDEALAWWEDHWAQPCREGADVLSATGPAEHPEAIGSCRAVCSWDRALLLLQAVETLTGGATRAVGWLEMPLETGCHVVWRFASSRPGTPSLVPLQLLETIRSFGARVEHLRLDGAEDLPAWAFGGRGTPHADGGDAARLHAAIAATLEG